MSVVVRALVLGVVGVVFLAGCGSNASGSAARDANVGAAATASPSTGAADDTAESTSSMNAPSASPGAAATANAAKAVSTFPTGVVEVVRYAVPVADYHAMFEQAVAARYRPAFLDGYDVAGQTYFNVVFRPDSGPAWYEYSEMSAAGYQSRFDSLTSQGYRLTFVNSYVNGGQIRYAAIWEKSTGPASFAFHGYSAAAYQSMLDAKTSAGYLPAQVSVVSVGGSLSYTGLLIQRSLGSSWLLKSTLSAADYQNLFNAQTSAGRGLAYLDTYTQNATPMFVALFAAAANTATVARHGMSASDLATQLASQEKAGYLTRAVSGYEQDGSARFAAYWSR